MTLKHIEIEGYRGFAKKQILTFAIPDGKTTGSGITFIFGANNSGKSALLEAVKFFGGDSAPEISKSQRNDKKERRVNIKLVFSNKKEATLQTSPSGGSVTELNMAETGPSIFYLPSKRFINHQMSRSGTTRVTATRQLAQKGRDNQQLNYFPGRLFNLLNDQKRLVSYNSLLKKILGYDLKWTIDLEGGSHYIQYELDGSSHTSEGAGDGIINLMIIADALHDANAGDVVLIDEPEVSLHPSAQKRLYSVIREFSANIQIVLSTHSPFFMDFRVLSTGAKAARLYKESDEIRIAQLPDELASDINAMLKDNRNPHLLGLSAREVFFAADHVLLVEGQDDVICLYNASHELQMPIEANVFGWGVGGESKMRFFAKLLHSLEYKKVFGLLDAGTSSFKELQKEFPHYHFHQITTEDIRDKDAEKEKTLKKGLFDTSFQLKKESKDEVSNLLLLINSKLKT